jgi:hypothetical protein
MSFNFRFVFYKKFAISLMISIILASNSFIMLKGYEINCKLDPKNQNNLLSKLDYENKKQIRLKTKTDPSNMSYIPYRSEQGSNFSFSSRERFSLNTTETCPTSIKSDPVSSLFLLDSRVSAEKTVWVNNFEPNCGEINITKIFVPEVPYYQFEFSPNNETPISGASNINFHVSSNPHPVNYSTNISFEFQIPEIEKTLLNAVHSLVIELRFNNASINFVLSDNGSSFGTPLEENVYKPGTNSLYILYNDSYPTSWNIISKNITRLITTYFSPGEFSWFNRVETLFCYLITFIPDYSLKLDMRSFNLSTILPVNYPVMYLIGNSTIYSEDGTIEYNYNTSAISVQVEENSTWIDNQKTFFNLSITRRKELFTQPAIIDWNSTILEIEVFLIMPKLLSEPQNRHILMGLPYDWHYIQLINSSATIKTLNQISLLSGSLLGIEYLFSLLESHNLTFRCKINNYLSNICSPSSASHFENIDISGVLLEPYPGTINLFLINHSIYLHQTTIVMLNGSFNFPFVTIPENIPIGFFNLMINWSCGYEFGLFEKLFYIHQTHEENSLIMLSTPKNYELYEYDPFFVNLTLFQNDHQYTSESSNVFIVVDSLTYKLNRSSNGYFHMTISHVLWPPKQHNISIMAFDNEVFFAEESLNVSIYPAVLDWYINTIPTIIYPNSNFSFNIEVFAHPLEGGTIWPISGVRFNIHINDSLITNCISDNFGHTNVFIPSEIIASHNKFQLLMIGTINGNLVKIQSFVIEVSNESMYNDRFQPVIIENASTPIVSNSSFYQIFNVFYPLNLSQWYIPINEIHGYPISAHLIRNDYTLEIDVFENALIWDLEGNSSNMDTLVLEFFGPTVLYTIIQETPNYEIQLTSYSTYTFSDYTLELDVDFVKFPLSGINLLDILKRDISDKFEIVTDGSTVFLKKLNIIEGIRANYYLEIEYDLPLIEILNRFKPEYAYDEPINGSWRLSSPINFSYVIEFIIDDHYHSFCKNTSLNEFENKTFIVAVLLPEIDWNSTIDIRLNLLFSNGISTYSSIQTTKIIDPYPPDCIYFVEQTLKTYDLHLIISESDQGSGIDTIRVLLGDIDYNITSVETNHYIIQFLKKELRLETITVIIRDGAGNINEVFIEPEVIFTPKSSNETLNPTILVPSIISIVFIGGLSFINYIKKKRSLIL